MPSPKPLPFQEAIDFLRQKVRLPSKTWTDLKHGQHARAFVVAGAIKAQLIADFHNAVIRAIAEGRTKEDFQRDFDSIVAKHGWSYKGGRGWRSAVIYNTNLRTARASGQWAQIIRLKDVRPWLRYEAVLDSSTRPLHRKWHGTILRWDDPWWQTHFPPNGWNCRCTVVTLSDDDLKRYGFQPSKTSPAVSMEKRTINTLDGPKLVDVPEGIDTGFAYNVGEASWGRGQELAALEQHGPWEALDVSPAVSGPLSPLPAVKPQADLGLRMGRLNVDRLRASFEKAIGGTDVIFEDPTGTQVLVGQAIVDHMLADQKRLDGREAFFPLLPELVTDPQEIWFGFAKSAVTGRVALRRRYVKLVDLGKDRAIALVADADNGMFSGVTFLRGDPRYLATLRSGVRVYQSGE